MLEDGSLFRFVSGVIRRFLLGKEKVLMLMYQGEILEKKWKGKNDLVCVEYNKKKLGKIPKCQMANHESIEI